MGTDMWTYVQSSGHLIAPNGELLAVGYSGHGEGLNNPAMQNVKNVGPIPVGYYSMGHPFDAPDTGEYSIPLIPHDGNEMFGRDGFRMHGDKIGHVGEFLASDGCIIQSLGTRVGCWESGDHVVHVVAEAA